eukprot:jgi/Tetstr1/423154/TSEL_013922.t1
MAIAVVRASSVGVSNARGRFQPAATSRANYRLPKVRPASRTSVRCLASATPDNVPLLDDGSGNGGNWDGGDGRKGYGGGGGDGFHSGGGGAMLAAVPVFDIAAKIDLTVENLLLLLACVVLPVLGIYLKRNSLDKYVLTGLVLTFLPPLGIIFAIAHVFFGWRPL